MTEGTEPTAAEVRAALRALADPARAASSATEHLEPAQRARYRAMR
ncbi:hypothetical protein [Agromyces sp. SYSU T00266]